MVEGVCEADGLVVLVPGAEPPRHVVHVVTRQEPVLQYGTIGFNNHGEGLLFAYL